MLVSFFLPSVNVGSSPLVNVGVIISSLPSVNVGSSPLVNVDVIVLSLYL